MGYVLKKTYLLLLINNHPFMKGAVRNSAIRSSQGCGLQLQRAPKQYLYHWKYSKALIMTASTISKKSKFGS